MSPNMPIIRRLTLAMQPVDTRFMFISPEDEPARIHTARKFYMLHFTDGALEVFDDEEYRDSNFKHYWANGRTSVRLTYDNVLDVEILARNNETIAEYRLSSPLSASERETIEQFRATRTVSKGESFGHPYCPPSSGLSDELESHIINVAHTVRAIDPEQWESYVLEVLTHPEYDDTTLGTVFARYTSNPDAWGHALLQGMLAVHQYWVNA